MVVHNDYITKSTRPFQTARVKLSNFSHVTLINMGRPGDEATVNNTKDVLIQGLKGCGLALCSF